MVCTVKCSILQLIFWSAFRDLWHAEWQVYCRSQAAQENAAAGYKKGKGAASDAASYASETAESVKDSAADAASQAYAFIQTYLSWGESKAKESKDATSKSIQVSF